MFVDFCFLVYVSFSLISVFHCFSLFSLIYDLRLFSMFADLLLFVGFRCSFTFDVCIESEVRTPSGPPAPFLPSHCAGVPDHTGPTHPFLLSQGAGVPDPTRWADPNLWGMEHRIKKALEQEPSECEPKRRVVRSHFGSSNEAMMETLFLSPALPS